MGKGEQARWEREALRGGTIARKGSPRGRQSVAKEGVAKNIDRYTNKLVGQNPLRSGVSPQRLEKRMGGEGGRRLLP
jgi:hypothetical protein